jgi:hypothetical protein
MADHTEAWDSSAARRTDRPRPLESARCSLCGIELPKGLMMPDGGRACADVRWYCRDTKSCTERWTAHPPRPARMVLDPPTPRPSGPGRAAPAPGPKGPKALEAAPKAARTKTVPAEAEQ